MRYPPDAEGPEHEPVELHRWSIESLWALRSNHYSAAVFAQIRLSPEAVVATHDCSLVGIKLQLVTAGLREGLVKVSDRQSDNPALPARRDCSLAQRSAVVRPYQQTGRGHGPHRR